jgi:hypothetical protein
MDTYENKFSSWFLGLTGKQRDQYESLEKLVLSFNSKAKKDIERTKKKYNTAIRSKIIDKTGLNLSFKRKGAVSEIDTQEKEEFEKIQAPISLEDTVPSSLLILFDKYDPKLIDLLLHYRRMKTSMDELAYQRKQFEYFSEFHFDIIDKGDISESISHLKILIERVENSKIIDEIKKLGPEVLGSYNYKTYRIELYWVSIVFCSIIFDMSVEAFTIVVLAHELSHAYTHLGFDKDGNNWETKLFANSDLRIIEGFAQFYTEMLSKDFFQQALPAFNALLPKQSKEYTDYKSWFDEKEKNIYEKARRLLLGTRNNKTTDYSTFKNYLRKVKKDF